MKFHTLALVALGLGASSANGSAPSSWRITPDGIGPVRIGMTPRQVTRAIGRRLSDDRHGRQSEECIEVMPQGREGLWLMFERGRLTRVSVRAPSRIRTPRGIGIGATEAAVRRAYAGGLKAEPHKYSDPPARYLTYWTVPGARGVRFETGLSRRVEAIHAGSQSIEYVEGCL